jgi:hypothetical protein
LCCPGGCMHWPHRSVPVAWLLAAAAVLLNMGSATAGVHRATFKCCCGICAAVTVHIHLPSTERTVHSTRCTTLAHPTASAHVQVCQQKLESFSSHELGLLLWAFAMLAYNPGGAFMMRSLELLQQQLPAASTQSLANVLWATAVLQHVPGQDFLRAAAASVAAQAKGYSHQSLGMALWGLASLLPPAGLLLDEPELQRLSAQSELMSANYDGKSMRMIQWALGVLAGQGEAAELEAGDSSGGRSSGSTSTSTSSTSSTTSGKQGAAELERLFE